VGKGNLIATQFHPEKSHNTGLGILKNFVKNIIDLK
jgi:glutamine amidotransferase